MSRSITAAVAGLFLLLTFSSGADAQRRRTPKRPPVKAAEPAASGAVRTPSGLTYLILKKGTGRLPKNGDIIIYHYTGTFTNGKKFDSSWDRNEPLAFKLGAKQVIKGTEEGMTKLRVGDHAFMVLPPHLAYAERGFPGAIPPNSTLVFTVEVLDIKERSISDELSKLAGGAAMVARYRELKKSNFDNNKIYSTESELNMLGYRLLAQQKVEDALAILTLNTQEYPASANVYDSLGEAYLAAGQKQRAIEFYEKALSIDPKFPSALDALKKLRSEQ